MDQSRGTGGLSGPSDQVSPALPSSTRVANFSHLEVVFSQEVLGRPGRTDMPTLQHSRQAPGQGRRAAQFMCAWCCGHVRSDRLLHIGDAIRAAPPGAGKGLRYKDDLSSTVDPDGASLRLGASMKREWPEHSTQHHPLPLTTVRVALLLRWVALPR
jgi:hypothetical protein